MNSEKINVLQFICPTGLHGAERWILALAKHLYPLKADCHLAVTHESEEQDAEIYDRFRELGLEAHKIKMKGRFDLKGIINLCRLIRKHDIHIIHTHGYKSDIIGLLAAKMTQIKTLSTPHGFENAKDIKLQIFIRLGCFALRFFDRVAPLSEELASDMHRIKIPVPRIKLIKNGVDLEELKSEENLDSVSYYPNRNEKKIGYVGQLIFRKNLTDLILAFDLLYKEDQNIRLIIIGDGTERKSLESLAHSLDSSKKIEFLGYRGDRLKFIKELDIFSMTSSLEGIPRCMMEAMGMGIPVAAYNIPGVDKLILHEKTGLMADYGDIKGLKECWKRLFCERKFANEISRNGRKHVAENFSAKRMAEEYLDLFQTMINFQIK